MKKLIATLIITLVMLQGPVATLSAGSNNWICKLGCWFSYEYCSASAEAAYQRCRRYGEEAQCQYVYYFEMRICNREYSRCKAGCR